MSPRAATTQVRHVLQRPGQVYRFQAPHGAVRATAQVVHLQARIAVLEAALAERTAQLRQVVEAAETDALTGLKNRRALEQSLRAVVADWQRYGHKAAVLLLDLDGFKPINDTHGHAAGDAALQHVARLFKRHTRESDIVARLGGDEFVIILREVDTAAAMGKARELRRILQTTPCLWEGKPLTLGASVGIATVMEAPTPEAVLEKADARMYRFKQVAKAGR